MFRARAGAGAAGPKSDGVPGPIPAGEPEAAPGPARAGLARFGTFVGSDGREVDSGYVVVFRPPRSFTGEEIAEMWAHGSPAVLRSLMEAAVAAGSRPAGPGEFSLRAFLNGRIDLTQAEAIRDLVEARTRDQARAAHEQ